MALDHAIEHPSRRAAVTSTAAKIGCTQQTLHDWVKKAEVDSGKRPGVPTEMAEKLKALERENRARGSRKPDRDRGRQGCSSRQALRS
jgi:transposase